MAPVIRQLCKCAEFAANVLSERKQCRKFWMKAGSLDMALGKRIMRSTDKLDNICSARHEVKV